MVGIKHITAIIALLFISNGFTQITEGKIIFERKTNLLKKFNDSRMAEMLKDQKIKVDMFELYFNETNCAFKPIESAESDQFSWTTSKNTVHQNISTQERISIMDLYGNKVYVKDSITSKQWQITDSRRTIANYECRKAIWQKDDSTRIYAWFSTDIVPSVGPEMFAGLPGAILGLATEDGGIIYFAQEVIVMGVAPEKFEYQLGKNELYTVEKLRTELEARFANQPWGKRAIVDLFRWF
jgi:GLPGLI family protein